MGRLGRFFVGACALLTLLVVTTSGAFAQSTDIGRVIENIAYMSYDTDEGDTVTVATSPAVFRVEARKTPSQVHFFRYAPSAPDRVMMNIAETYVSPSQSLYGPFMPMQADYPFPNSGEMVEVSGYGMVEERLSADVPVIPTTHYFAGDITIICVEDEGQNGNPLIRERLSIKVETSAGDQIVVDIVESGPNSGRFLGYIVTAEKDTDPSDDQLSVHEHETLTATYEDQFDDTEVATTTALVDPNGRIFDSTTGQMLNGITVRVVDAATGQLAPVFGFDGISEYPAELVTGGVVTDASGRVYDLEDGEFLFPLMPPGDYRMEFDPPPGYIYPSIVRNFDGLPNGPFDISEASFNRPFHLDGSGPLIFDIPLDPTSRVSIEKSAGVSEAAIGDFVPYSITVSNFDDSAGAIILQDTAPFGFRLIRESIRVNGLPVDASAFEISGRRFEFTPTRLEPGESMTIDYVMEVVAGARLGRATNRVVAVDGRGAEVSNAAEASITVIEDLLRSTATIIGRVTEGSCDLTDPVWDESDTSGIAGVRIYLETGEYVITDEEGRFHFEQVRPGSHVVRLDDGVLPPGVERLDCGSRTGMGHTGNTSELVDVDGGVIWRVNFNLGRYEVDESEQTEVIFNDATEHLTYGLSWLNEQLPERRWVYPAPERTPSTPSINIGIQHMPGEVVELYLNGARLAAGNFAGMELSTDRTTAISRWRSVDIEDGQNVIEARILNAAGLVTERLREEIWFTREATRAGLVEDRSVLVADGRTPPSIAVHFTDDGGRDVHSGRIIGVDVEAPYRLHNSGDIAGDIGISQSLADEGNIAIGADGIGTVRLEPTLETGFANIRIELDNGRTELVRAYIEPEPRPWIVVGLIEATAGEGAPTSTGIGGDEQESADGLTRAALDPFADGRIAIYAKGRVLDDWLATLSIDTDRQLGDYHTGFNREIDPSAAYSLFGDSTVQQNDAPSRYPLFLKLENGRFQALFGDYNTDMGETQLARYSRTLSGLRIMQDEERFAYSFFAAETNQGFVTDELAADGTSGPYQLSVAPILGQSETIVIETRERFRPDRILNQRVLTRFVDYDLDYRTGQLIFRAPVDAADAQFNPNVIVVTYETTSEAERHITAGGRFVARFADGAVEVGATAIHEGGSAQSAGQSSDLVGVDLRAELFEGTELRMEYAASQTENAGGQTRGDAVFMELLHQSDDLAFTAYYREEGTGFGVGQTNSNTEDIRRYGVTGSYQLGQTDSSETGLRSTRSIVADASREENLETGERRDTASVSLAETSQDFGAEMGVRYAREELQSGDYRQSVLVAAGIQRAFDSIGLTLSARHEQPMSEDNIVSSFPERTVLGIDKTIGDIATVFARHEFVQAENGSGQNSILGLELTPWTGGSIRAQADMALQEATDRMGAVFGVDQTLRISEVWSVSLGIARRANFDSGDAPVDPLADDVDTPLEFAQSSILTDTREFQSAYVGAAFRTPETAASARLEVRDTAEGTRYTGVLSAAQQVSEDLSFAGAARAERFNRFGAEDTEQFDVRVGMSYRPNDSGITVYDRLDLQSESVGEDQQSWRIVNNLAANLQLSDNTQGSIYLGSKYVETEVNGTSYSGFTQLVGGQYRMNITDQIDVGVSASAIWSENSGTVDYSFGPNIGYSPNENIWISAGYNIQGYEDPDFETAEYSRSGPYVTFRMQFDEGDIAGLAERVGW
jgi:uncharacterized repeat protein (TIGR01451 family)